MDAVQRRQVGERVRELRDERGWSQKRLADAAGVSENTIIAIEKGTRQTQEGKLRPVLAALGIEPERGGPDIVVLDGVPEDARIFLRIASKRLAAMDDALRGRVLADLYPRLLVE